MFPQTLLIFIIAPSWDELERRLVNRGTESLKIIHKRIVASMGECDIGIKNYDYCIQNNILDDSLNKLIYIINMHRMLYSK